jgi:RimJ/RimL family protein N-acetyltransferase
MTGITIREPGQLEAEQLSAVLCNDNVLRHELGFAAHDKPTAEDFLREIAEWCRPRRATTYAILADNTAIGTISLSHRSPDGLSAQVGYWIGSGYRRLGYCTRAFATVLNQAASEGIVFVSATIASDNIPSRRIWEYQGAVASEVSSGRLQYKLKIERQPVGAGDALLPA